jgi:hypothetical protein
MISQVKSENDEYQKQALFVTGHRQELFQLVRISSYILWQMLFKAILFYDKE